MRSLFAIAIFCLFSSVYCTEAQGRKYDLSQEFTDSRYSGHAPAQAPQAYVVKKGKKAYRKAKRQIAKTVGTIAGYARTLATGANNPRAEASLTPALREVISDLRSKHGDACVVVEGGRSDRAVKGGKRRSCHWGGEAFDGRLCPAARADVRSRPALGSITYSGAMSHDHVSLCRHERGVRTHLVVNKRGVPVRLAKKHKRQRYARAG